MKNPEQRLSDVREYIRARLAHLDTIARDAEFDQNEVSARRAELMLLLVSCPGACPCCGQASVYR